MQAYAIQPHTVHAQANFLTVGRHNPLTSTTI